MNPNGLTDEQIAARPEPFVGMIWFIVDMTHCKHGNGWRRFEDVKHVSSYEAYGDKGIVLLPGENNCPWPPPEEFRHEWKVGETGFITLTDGQWYNMETRLIDYTLWFAVFVLADTVFVPIDRPAIYIPESA